MSQFEKSEVMIKYAELMQVATTQSGVGDYAAAMAESISYELGIGAVVSAAGAAGLGAGGGVMGSIVGAVGLGGMLTNPVGWIIGGVAVSTLIWGLSKASDDNITDLTARLDALSVEGGSPADQKKQEWAQALGSYKSQFALPPTTTDQEQLAAYNQQQYNVYVSLTEYLKGMAQVWPSLEPQLTDWFGSWGDPGQFKVALDKTLAAMTQSKQKLDQTIKQDAAKRKEQALVNIYKALSPAVNKIQDAISKLTINGKAPAAETDAEKKGLDLFNKLVAKQATLEDIASGADAMIEVYRTMGQELKRRTGGKSASIKNISKRALLLGDGTSIKYGPGKATRAPGKQKATRRGKDPNVAALQKMVNELNARYRTPQARQIMPDGRYGPNTADAVRRLLVQVPEMNSQLEQSGVTSYNAGDYRLMAKDPRNYAAVRQVLGRFIQGTLPTGSGPRGISTRAPGRQQVPREGVPENKENMSPTEINRALRLLQVTDPKTGKQESAFNWLLKNYEGGSPAQVVYKVFKGKSAELPGYRSWDPQALVDWVLSIQGKPTRSKSYKRDSGPAPAPNTARLRRSPEQSMYVRFRSPNTGNPTNLRDWLTNHGGYRTEQLRKDVISGALQGGARSAQDVIDYVNQVGGALLR